MSNVTITVDAKQWDEYIDALNYKLANSSPGMQMAVDEYLIRALQFFSASNWNVRSGAFSNGWTTILTGPQTLTVFNTAPHSGALETGFTAGFGSRRVFVAGKPTMAMAFQSCAIDMFRSFFTWVYAMNF